jgi:hypothetical protein
MAFDKKLRVVCTLVFCFTLSGQEHLAQGIARLIAAYPAHIKEVNENSLTWADGIRRACAAPSGRSGTN